MTEGRLVVALGSVIVLGLMWIGAWAVLAWLATNAAIFFCAAMTAKHWGDFIGYAFAVTAAAAVICLHTLGK